MSIKAVEVLLDLLFPPRCPFCHELLREGEELFCAQCQKNLPWIAGERAEQKFEFVSCCVSPLWYHDHVRDSIHRYKFYSRKGYSKVYGRLTAQCIADHLADRYDLVTWAPLSRKSLRKRGYDQARLIAETAARELGTSAVPLLKKIRNTGKQSRLRDDAARRSNVLGAYRVIDPEMVRGKRVLLIDDVVTTGATLSECARELRTAGAADVVCAAVARAGRKTSEKNNGKDALSH